VNRRPLFHTPGIQAYTRYSRKRKNIYRLFNTLETPLSTLPDKSTQEPWVPDRRFVMREYERFSDLPTFFHEISTPLKIQAEPEGGFRVRMFNPETGSRQFYPGTPLCMIDGKLTRNGDFVATLDIDLIDTLELYYDFDKLRNTFGMLGYNGVVRITTYGASVQLPASESQYTLQVPGTLPALRSYASSPPKPGVPALNPIVYWNAEVETDAGGGAQVQVILGDATGTLEVEWAFQDQDGNFWVEKSYIEVRPKTFAE